MRTVYRRGLPTLLAVALTTGVVGFGTPALAAGEAPTGTFTLSANAIWAGQSVTLTQTALNDPEGDTVVRKISWGDGGGLETNGDETSWTHTYNGVPGTPYTVTVTLSDGEAEVPGTLASPSVAVTTPPGTLGWKNSTVWTYPGYYNEATFAPTNLPTNADQAWTDWKDGEYTLLRQGATSTEAGHWYPTGTFAPTVQFENKNGKATARTANALSVRDDTTNPTAAFTWPATARNAAKSYATLRGTGRDSQSGADGAEVWVYKWNNAGFVAYWDFAKKNWIKYNGGDIPMTAVADVPVSASGTWAVPVSGFAKGWAIEVGYSVYDKVGNYSPAQWADFTLTS